MIRLRIAIRAVVLLLAVVELLHGIAGLHAIEGGALDAWIESALGTLAPFIPHTETTEVLA